MRIMARTAAAAAGLAIAVTTGLGAASADPGTQPTGDDIVGVGSDTTQFALNDLAAAYNDGTAPDVASWDAFNPGTGLPGDTIWISDEDGDGVADPGEQIVRPNGSSAGVNELRRSTGCSATGNSAAEFARSSRARQTGDSMCGGVVGGVQVLFLPFATDDLRYAVNDANLAVEDYPADTAATNAPLDLTTAELRSIYNCTADQWSDLRSGASTQTIDPLAPQSGSGTRSAFLSALGLTAFGSCVDDTVQEHDAHPVDGDPNTIAPFSVGRFNTQVPADANGDKPVQLSTGGFLNSRPLFNVVIDQTPADGTNPGGVAPKLHGFLGDNDFNYGWICSDEAAPVIEAAGFTQLGTIDDGEFTNPCGIAQ